MKSLIFVFRCSDIHFKDYLLKQTTGWLRKDSCSFSWHQGFWLYRILYSVQSMVKVSLKHFSMPTYLPTSFNFTHVIPFLIFIMLISKLLNAPKKIHPVSNEQSAPKVFVCRNRFWSMGFLVGAHQIHPWAPSYYH